MQIVKHLAKIPQSGKIQSINKIIYFPTGALVINPNLVAYYSHVQELYRKGQASETSFQAECPPKF